MSNDDGNDDGGNDAPPPLNCYASTGDGFSGWYATRDQDTCTDFCFWDVQQQNDDGDGDGSSSSSHDYGPNNTADPHRTTSIATSSTGGGGGGRSTWRCVLDGSGDSTTVDALSSSSSKLTEAGAFGTEFPYLRCHRYADETLRTASGDVVQSKVFWSFMLVISIVVFVVEGCYCVLVVRRSKQRRRRRRGWRRGRWPCRRSTMDGGEEDGEGVIDSSSSFDVAADVAFSAIEQSSSPSSEEEEEEQEPRQEKREAARETPIDCSSVVACEIESAVLAMDIIDENEVESSFALAPPVGEEENPSASSTTTRRGVATTTRRRFRTKWSQWCSTRWKHRLKKCLLITSLIVLNVFLLLLTIVSTASLHELSGHYVTRSSAMKLTPACADPDHACDEANRDIDRPSSSLSSSSTPPPHGPFAYLIASDAQVDWYNGESSTLGTTSVPPSCSTSDSCNDCTSKFGKHTNDQMKTSMERLFNNRGGYQPGGGVGEEVAAAAAAIPNTLIMNGDLTAYFHPDQRHQYESVYHNLNGLRHYFPGLGNHDYDHKAGGRYGGDQWPMGPPYCNTAHAVSYMKRGLCGNIPNFDPERIVRYDASSLAYSWEEGRYHFVQVHFYPTFEIAKFGIKSSFTWLERDLTLAHEAGLTSILFVHAAQGLNYAMENVLRDKNVKAIFAGHSHRCLHRKCAGLSILSEDDVSDGVHSTRFQRADKCIPGSLELCGYISGMSLYYLRDTHLPVPVRRLQNPPPSSGSNPLCPKASPTYINETDNTLLCVESTTCPSEFPFRDDNNNETQEKIPIFWSGSSSFETFLRADFYDDRFVVNALTAVAGREGERYIDVNSVPNAVYPYHSASDLEEVTIYI